MSAEAAAPVRSGSGADPRATAREVLSQLRCPTCLDGTFPADTTAGTVECTRCGCRVELVPHLVRPTISATRAVGIAQRLMHSPPVVSIYERAWRPFITRLVTDVSWDDEITFLRTHLPADPAARIFDWCCGTGAHGRLVAARLRAPGLVLGVDASAPMARAAAAMARSHGVARQIIVEGHLTDIRPRDLFDGGFCFAALHLLNDQAAAVAHMASTLRPGAPFLCLTLHERDDAGLSSRRIAQRIGFRLPSRAALEATIAAAGFALAEVHVSRHALMFSATRR